MTLDEAIKHAEEVAEEQDILFKRYDEASRYSRTYKEGWKSTYAKNALECFECAKEHRQLAEWLKELKQLKEQKPCEDAISRQDDCTVIKKLSKKYYVEDAYGYTDEDIVNKVNEIIDAVNKSIIRHTRTL